MPVEGRDSVAMDLNGVKGQYRMKLAFRQAVFPAQMLANIRAGYDQRTSHLCHERSIHIVFVMSMGNADHTYLFVVILTGPLCPVHFPEKRIKDEIPLGFANQDIGPTEIEIGRAHV